MVQSLPATAIFAWLSSSVTDMHPYDPMLIPPILTLLKALTDERIGTMLS
jgi:predicted histidine transporter YuiF (NhaC family)